MITRETDLTKRESSTSDHNTKASASSATTSWSRLKDPRIVRVSRAFGGKDRHSKVCTVRGLRDRRVRLSVPTAIQLYDLQDRLGLSQPSKVVDWLLNAAKHEIDELPPLQIPPGTFTNNNPSLLSMLNSHEIRASQSEKQGLKIGEGKSQGTSAHTNDSWERNEGERQFDLENQESYVCSDNFLGSRQNPSSLSSLMNSCIPSYNSFVRWDPSNLTLSHPPRSHGLLSNPPEDWHNFSLIPLQPAASVPSGSHQVLVYQPGMSTQSYFQSQIGGSNAELDSKQLHFQSAQLSHVESNTQSVRPIHINMTANLLPSQSNDGR